jgi:hypothetical protein
MVKRNLYIDGYEITGSFPEPESNKFIRAMVSSYHWSPGALPMQEVIELPSDGYTFTLTYVPVNSDVVLMFINGIKQDLGIDYTVNSNTVVYTGSLTLLPTDEVEFWYVYVESPLLIDGLMAWWEPGVWGS